MKAALKRLMNVASLMAGTYFLAIISMALFGAASDWKEFALINGSIIVASCAAISAINYVLFGAATLWNRNA
ncbi:MAG: hypothetical protein Q8L99_04605 [Polycyclovorans sp.]|nr:hypothetical protein [Polycyclovorans sp.]